MKKLQLLIIGILLVSFNDLNAQLYDFNLDAIASSSGHFSGGRSFKKGETVHFDGLYHKIAVYSNGFAVDKYYLMSDNDSIEISKRKNQFTYIQNTPDEIWNSSIISSVIPKLIKNGTQTDVRSEMEEDALQYIQSVQGQGLEFNDPYLESYLYSLISKIAPTTLIDGRPFSINLLIMESPEMNAGMYPNGTLVINTGLIASLHTEDELVAILCHEIAHFVLDHSIQNINLAIARQKRAEFWSGVAVGVTAVAEGVYAANNEYYVPGAATVATAIAAVEIAEQVVDRLGMKYNNDQESEADELAKTVLGVLGYDVNGLSTALSRVQNVMLQERTKTMYFASFTHPALVNRIADAGTPYSKVDPSFEKIISFAVTNTARMKYESRRFKQSLDYSTQNINNGVGTAEDYILRANCLLKTKTDESSNKEIKNLIKKATEIDPSNINLYKSDIIASLRLGNNAEAIELLNQYIAEMDKLVETSNFQSPDIVNMTYAYVTNNKQWANNMLVKLKGF